MGPGLHRLEPEKAACLELIAIRKNKSPAILLGGGPSKADNQQNLRKKSSDQFVNPPTLCLLFSLPFPGGFKASRLFFRKLVTVRFGLYLRLARSADGIWRRVPA